MVEEVEASSFYKDFLRGKMTPVPRESWHYKDLSPRNSQVNTQQRVAYRAYTTNQHYEQPDYNNQIQFGNSTDLTHAEQEGQNDSD